MENLDENEFNINELKTIKIFKITTNGTTSHFYGPLTTGYPGPGGGPQHYHPIPGGHLQPPQIPHSPSPPTNYHNKDDQRTTRNNQHKKPMKFEKQREINSTKSTPAHSPRKTDINGLRRTSRNGASSVGTSEDGEESSSVPDDEDDCQTIIDQLSAVQKPEVTEITSRSAMLRWEAPPSNPDSIINNRDLRYEVLLSDRGKEGKYKIIFKGESYSCMIQDLRPGQEYFVCLQVHYEKIQGSASEPTVFTTPPCEPDQPLPPDLNLRTKSTLQLRWRPPCDNGSHINHYILEYDDGKSKGFIETIKTKSKQYTLSKLQPSTRYSFRLTAVNECGPSLQSDLVHYSTTINPPTTPKPPQLQAASSNSLRLVWDRRSQDEKFTLQFAERECGHGFLNMYDGPDTVYECSNLKRATVYQFRLRAANETGFSSWSNEVTYKTQPERPGRPSKPQIKGKIHGNYFKAKWDPPNDRGGAEIRKYFLEISSGAKFERIYSGQEPETICDRLSPGTTYQIRVACEGPSGTSNYSELCTVTTEAIIPGAPDPPYCDNAPGPYAAVLKWDAPDYNGGAPVLEYEVKLTGLPNYNDEIIYHGKDMYCICKNLLPGEEYIANVRGVNRIGAGIWSESMKFNAGAAPPNAPEQLEIQVRSATHLIVAWQEPKSNGAPISEYRLESSLTNESNSNYKICYQGIQTTVDVRDLIPYTLYYFRVNASNYAGCSQYSTIIQQKTPAACPGIPLITKSEITATELRLNWSEPESNGSKILHYRIEYSERTPCSIEISTKENVNEFTIKNLASETSYKFKIQAVNEIGAGQWSVPLKLTTWPPPPEPPILECTGVGPNFIRLKWGEGKNIDFTKYYVEMYNNRTKNYQEIYRGNGYMCKVYKLHKLQEQTEYIFRIYAETDNAGAGDWSPEYRFKTSAILPSSIKQLKIAPETTTDISTNNNNSHNNTGIFIGSNTIEWQPSKNSFNDPVEYILQCSNGKETDYRQIHRGPDTKYTIENLEPGSVYLFRVCPVRCSSNGDINGSFTTPVRYQVPLYKLSTSLISSAAAATTINNSGTTINSDHLDGNSTSTGGGGLSSITATVYHNTNRIPNLLHRITGNHLTTSNNYTNTSNNLTNNIIGGSIIDKNHHISSNIQQLQQLSNFYDLTNNVKENTIATAAGNHNNNNNSRISGAIKRFIDKIYALYSSRKRFTDTQKAIFWTFSLLLLTFIFAALLSMFMR